LDDGKRGCFGASTKIITFDSLSEDHTCSQSYIVTYKGPRIKLHIRFDIAFVRFMTGVPNTAFNCHTNEWKFPTHATYLIELKKHPSVIILESPHITTIKHIITRKLILITYPYEFGQFRHLSNQCKGMTKDQILLPDDLLDEIKKCLYENELKFIEFSEWDDKHLSAFENRNAPLLDSLAIFFYETLHRIKKKLIFDNYYRSLKKVYLISISLKYNYE
jgi:hypothetical protein